MDTEAVGGLTDSLACNQAAVCNEGDGLLGAAGLEIAQDHMELIQKFMIERPCRVSSMDLAPDSSSDRVSTS